jgi:PqqD family protein of HPr-rel-A system
VRYAAEPGEGVARIPLDSLTALYHRRSGQTHVVAAPVPEILDALAGEALDAAALLAALGIDDDAEARLLLEARLNELVESGLLAVVP